jgi:hypothetical protein
MLFVVLIVANAKNLWKGLKQQHSAYLRKLQNPTGSARKNEPTFRHSQTMAFMSDSYVSRKTTSNFQKPQPALNDDDMGFDMGAEDDPLSESNPGAALLAVEADNRNKKRKNAHMDEFDRRLLEKLDTAFDKTKDNQDESYYFVMSILPSLRRISSSNPLSFGELKMSILRLITESEVSVNQIIHLEINP